jgi:elongator complex protein 1
MISSHFSSHDLISAFVSVGWGRKETQFHGSAGKAKPTTSSSSSLPSLGPDEDYIPRISWRGDGDYFCISTVDAAQEGRVLLFFNREAQLQNKSENVPNLEHALSWKPSGELIASSQKLSHKHDIVFFERNGLRHGEFTLRGGDTDSIRVKSLDWNADSSLLAMDLEIITKKGNIKRHAVQLWGSMNYHWYLRYELEVDMISMQWDEEEPLLLRLLAKDGTCHENRFGTLVLKSTSLSPLNNGTVAVVDGHQVLLTPFKKHNIPPPMSHIQTKHAAPVIHVAFSPSDASDDIAVLLANHTIEFRSSIASMQKDVITKEILDISTISTTIRQILWIHSKELLLVGYHSTMGSDQVSIITFDGDSISNIEPIDIPGQEKVMRLFQDLNHKITAIETITGKIFEISKIEGDWYCIAKITFPTPCPWVAFCQVGTEPCWIGLSERNKLYINDSVLLSNCTSFTLSNEFLIASTLEHVARFLSLSLPLDGTSCW